MPPSYQTFVVQSKPTDKLPYRELQFPTYMKDTDRDVHIKVFKKAIRTNGKTMEANIINLFGFTLPDNILEWGENFVQDHPYCIFEELEQAFCKHFQIVKNDEEIYMQLKNFQQQVDEQIEIYYKRLLKLVNRLQVKAIDVFFTIISRAGLQPYLKLTIKKYDKRYLYQA
jgi:hypothetical protein